MRFNQLFGLRTLIVALVLPLALGACGARPDAGAGDGQTSGEEAYLTPPAPDAVGRDAAGVVLSGRAPPGGKVRLAGPDGRAMFAPVDARGRWTIPLGPAAGPHIFGLSAVTAGRSTQAEGYVVVAPAGQVALLRAGAAAERIDRAARPGLSAVDFDAGGGLQIACSAPPRATVILRLDGRQVAEGRADAAGRYVVSLPPATQSVGRRGTHVIEMEGDGIVDRATVTLSPAAPLAAGPLRSQLTPAGLRLDWMTPGGGVQSTVLVH